MSELTIAIIAVFASVALVTASAAAFVLGRISPGRRRLTTMSHGIHVDGLLANGAPLTETTSSAMKRVASLIPRSPKAMTRVQRRLTMAGYHSAGAAIVYSLAEFAVAAVAFLATLAVVGMRGIIFAAGAAFLGYMIPGVLLHRRVARRKKEIQNGLPDALDMFIVCLEAGVALDQAILKASEELEIAYPALGHELRLINIETRAGKPRIEALKNFAKRTQVDDVRALVAMLVQTDRFGTSVGLALRTHAEESRVKRRQRAEEKAAKLGVKLVFPLVFCLLPAFFVVSLGPGIIKLMQFFTNNPGLGGSQ